MVEPFPGLSPWTLVFVAEKTAHICGLKIFGRDYAHNLRVRSLLGSEGFLFRFGIGLRDLVSEILWAEKSKLASQGPTREGGRAGKSAERHAFVPLEARFLTFQ